MSVRFSAPVAQQQGTSPYVDVPDEVLAQISEKRRVPVAVTVNGYTFRTTIAPMKGCLLLGFNKVNAAAAQVAAGDVIDIEMDLDTAPREVDVPVELRQALAAVPQAQAAYEALSYTHRREWAQYVATAKQAQTRVRRAAKAVAQLDPLSRPR
ncbi:MAG: YdeI/OmpD-associated family protein [Candidatus Nanopelagicales bacterium]